jgi:predicted TIM-barrel fold metal-dependent hydrolase
VIESGIEWVPWLTSRLNRAVAKRPSEAPLLEKTPEEYVRDQFYFGTQPFGEPNDKTQTREILDIIGADSLIFTSDYPHFDFYEPSAVSAYFSHFSDKECEKIWHRNAAEAFGITV